MKSSSSECHRTSLMISQHCIGWGSGLVSLGNLDQCWPIFWTLYAITRVEWVHAYSHPTRRACSRHCSHDDVIKWKHFPRYWPFVRGIHRSPVNSPHKGQWRGALMFTLICVWINGYVNNREAGDLKRYCAHFDATVMGRLLPIGFFDTSGLSSQK